MHDKTDIILASALQEARHDKEQKMKNEYAREKEMVRNAVTLHYIAEQLTAPINGVLAESVYNDYADIAFGYIGIQTIRVRLSKNSTKDYTVDELIHICKPDITYPKLAKTVMKRLKDAGYIVRQTKNYDLRWKGQPYPEKALHIIW